MTESKKHDIGLDLGACNGCYGCVDLNPEIFGWDDDSERPFLIRQEATRDEVAEAIACCPGDCIFLEDED